MLRRGSTLVDLSDPGTIPRVFFYLEHSIQDASRTRSGERRVVSMRMLYAVAKIDGTIQHVHYAPYLDYRPLAEGEPSIDAILSRPECGWISQSLEEKVQSYAIATLVPEHLAEVREFRLGLNHRTAAAVKDRLTKEINYWDHRAETLKAEENAGKVNARLNSSEARKRADGLQARLEKRLKELALEAQIDAQAPVVVGGFLVIPAGLLSIMTGSAASTPCSLPRHFDSNRESPGDSNGNRASVGLFP